MTKLLGKQSVKCQKEEQTKAILAKAKFLLNKRNKENIQPLSLLVTHDNESVIKLKYPGKENNENLEKPSQNLEVYNAEKAISIFNISNKSPYSKTAKL